jgi:hypothetical protein
MCKNDRNCVAYNQDSTTKKCISYSAFAGRGSNDNERGSRSSLICWTKELEPFNEPWIKLEGGCRRADGSRLA